MSKKKPIEFWIVVLNDPTAEMTYEEYEGRSLHYVRTLKEARQMIEKHTNEYMPKEESVTLDALWEAYNNWTPFDPQTGQDNKPLDKPDQHTTLPLFEWKDKDGPLGTVVNKLAHTIGNDNIETYWNDGIWDGEFFAFTYLETIE